MRFLEGARGRPSPALIIAATALTLALAGSAIAAKPVGQLTKKDVRKIAKQEIEKRAPELSVLRATSADSATSAANADRLDNLDSGQFLRRDACQGGAVLGSARFDPTLMTAAPGYSTSGVTTARNCAGGSVEAHRLSEGDFRIRFNGLSASIMTCGRVSDGDNTLGPLAIGTSVIAPGHWRMRSGTTTNVVSDAPFACVVF